MVVLLRRGGKRNFDRLRNAYEDGRPGHQAQMILIDQDIDASESIVNSARGNEMEVRRPTGIVPNEIPKLIHDPRGEDSERLPLQLANSLTKRHQCLVRTGWLKRRVVTRSNSELHRAPRINAHGLNRCRVPSDRIRIRPLGVTSPIGEACFVRSHIRQTVRAPMTDARPSSALRGGYAAPQ